MAFMGLTVDSRVTNPRATDLTMPRLCLPARPPFRLFALSVLSVLSGCAVNPATGQRQFSLVSEGQEIAMGQQGAQEVEASLGLYPDSALQAYVARVGMSMASKSERPTLPWRFGVVEDAAITNW